jgi:hypothetical protein
MHNHYPTTMEEQLAMLQQQQQQQQQAQEQHRRLQDEMRRLDNQRLSRDPSAMHSNLFMNFNDNNISNNNNNNNYNFNNNNNINNCNNNDNHNDAGNNGSSNFAVSAAPPADLSSFAAALCPLSKHAPLQHHQQGNHNGFVSLSGTNRGNEGTTESLADGRAHAPNNSFPNHVPAAGVPNALEAALTSLLFNNPTQQQQQSRQNLDNLQLLHSLQQHRMSVSPPQDPYAALVASRHLPFAGEANTNFRYTLLVTGAAGKSQIADSLLNTVRHQVNAPGPSPNPLFASVPQQQPQRELQESATDSAHVSSATQKKKGKTSREKNQEGEPDDEEEYPLPNLPKVRPLPPLEEGNTSHFEERVIVPLATEEDYNWLSDRQCFIRAELLEIVRASHQDVLVRSSSKSVAYQQVGIRCRFCAHLHPSARAIRSSAYPSSIRQMYQSFTMMVRDHWAGCSALPPFLKKRFLSYQENKIPSSSLSREYWAYAANKIGMINTEYGITITEDSLAKAETLPSFGTTPEHVEDMLNTARETKTLVRPSDEQAISPYLFLLINQAEECYLLESERVGKRKEAPVGLTGFGCQHCIKRGRLGFCRVFPLNKRSMPTKVNDLYNHLLRCRFTPPETRQMLRQLKRAASKTGGKFNERDREFVDQIWSKLGRRGAQIGSD